MFRSILSLVLGVSLMNLLSYAAFIIVYQIMPYDFPQPLDDSGELWSVMSARLIVAMLSCDLLIATFSGYFTAAVAAHSPIRHAASLAMLALVMGLITIQYYADAQPSEPYGYSIPRVILAPMAVIFGGWIRARQTTSPKPTEEPVE